MPSPTSSALNTRIILHSAVRFEILAVRNGDLNLKEHDRSSRSIFETLLTLVASTIVFAWRTIAARRSWLAVITRPRRSRQLMGSQHPVAVTVQLLQDTRGGIDLFHGDLAIFVRVKKLKERITRWRRRWPGPIALTVVANERRRPSTRRLRKQQRKLSFFDSKEILRFPIRCWVGRIIQTQPERNVNAIWQVSFAFALSVVE